MEKIYTVAFTWERNGIQLSSVAQFSDKKQADAFYKSLLDSEVMISRAMFEDEVKYG